MSTDVMIVDDNRFMRQVVAHALRMAPLALGAVREAADGAQALALLRARPAGLVLLDLVMPVLDGEGLLTALRGDPALKSIPVVVVTSDTHPGRRERLHRLGAQVVGKPFTPEELTAALKTLGVADGDA